MSDYVTRWVSNLVWWKNWSDDNLKFWEITDYRWERFSSGKSTLADSISSSTLNQVAAWVSTSTAKPDISTPQNLLWNNITWGQADINMDTTLNDVVKPNPLSASEILWNTWIKESEKVTQAEEDVKNESRTKTVWNFFKSIGDSISDWNVSNILDTKRQAKEKTVAVWYNEDNHNILRLAFNEWQWIWDDFGDTVFNRWQWNKQIFDQLYSEYEDMRDAIENSWYDELTQQQMLNAAYDNLLKEVNERKLLKVYEDDFYSDWLIYWLLDRETKAVGRRKDQFSQEQLNRLSKSNIKEAWIYEVTPEQFDAFLDIYWYNADIADRYSLDDATDTAKVRYELEDEWLAQLKSIETHQIIDPAMAQIKALESDGTISEDTGTSIMQNSYTVVNDALNQMHLYLDEPLAYYKAVKAKDYWTLTTWEKAILWYGEGIMQFMDDYTKALQRWLNVSISQWIENWELVNSAEMIDGMSITEFFRNAISDANLKAWWLDLLATESAIDAMQHINNNINYLYWQWKGNHLRKAWTEAQRIWWAYWYWAWELYQMWIMWWVKWIEALSWRDVQSLADYDLADFTTWRMLATQDEVPRALRWISDSNDFAKLLKRYWLAALENVPEFAWELQAIRPFLWGTSKYAKLSSKAIQLEKTAAATRKLNWLSKIFNWIKNTVGTTSKAWWTKNWIAKMYEWVSNSLPPKLKATLELWTNVVKRKVKDQAIDAIASYYDTESYSTPSFLLSVWLTWLTETLPSLLWDTQLYKMIKNKIKWLNRTDWTWWRLMDIINSDEEILRRWGDIFGTDFNTFKLVAWSEWWWEVEDLMKAAYNMLSPDGKVAINNFTKQQLFEQLKNIKTIDWQSTYGRNLMSLINAQWSNAWDIMKYVLWIPWKVEFGWFTSSILFKEWAERQTRYLKQAYDIELDKITWQFRKWLENWFTKEQIEELASKTKYTDVIENWKVNSKYFEKDWDRYILNSDWANYLKLQITEYTDTMRKADAIRAQAEWDKEFLEDVIAKIWNWRWLSPEVVNKLATSWAYTKMVNEFSRVVC